MQILAYKQNNTSSRHQICFKNNTQVSTLTQKPEENDKYVKITKKEHTLTKIALAIATIYAIFDCIATIKNFKNIPKL